MAKDIHLLKKFLSVSFLAVLGTAVVAKADTLTYTNQQVYYVGPEAGDNPFGLTNPTGNTISYVGFPTTGTSATLTFTTTGAPGVSFVSNTPGASMNIQLYGNTSGMISGGQLVSGVYTFSDPLDVFTLNGSSNAGSNPTDIATITVATNGLVQLQSDSIGVVTKLSAISVPEIDPANATSALALIAICVTLIRRRK